MNALHEVQQSLIYSKPASGGYLLGDVPYPSLDAIILSNRDKLVTPLYSTAAGDAGAASAAPDAALPPMPVFGAAAGSGFGGGAGGSLAPHSSAAAAAPAAAPAPAAAFASAPAPAPAPAPSSDATHILAPDAEREQENPYASMPDDEGGTAPPSHPSHAMMQAADASSAAAGYHAAPLPPSAVSVPGSASTAAHTHYVGTPDSPQPVAAPSAAIAAAYSQSMRAPDVQAHSQSHYVGAPDSPLASEAAPVAAPAPALSHSRSADLPAYVSRDESYRHGLPTTGTAVFVDHARRGMSAGALPMAVQAPAEYNRQPSLVDHTAAGHAVSPPSVPASDSSGCTGVAAPASAASISYCVLSDPEVVPVAPGAHLIAAAAPAAARHPAVASPAPALPQPAAMSMNSLLQSVGVSACASAPAPGPASTRPSASPRPPLGSLPQYNAASGYSLASSGSSLPSSQEADPAPT